MVFWLQVGFQVIFVLSWLRHLASEDSNSFEALCATDIYVSPQSACSIGGLHGSVPSKPLSFTSFLLVSLATQSQVSPKQINLAVLLRNVLLQRLVLLKDLLQLCLLLLLLLLIVVLLLLPRVVPGVLHDEEHLGNEDECHGEVTAEYICQSHKSKRGVVLVGDHHGDGGGDDAEDGHVVDGHPHQPAVVDLLHLHAAGLVGKEEPQDEEKTLVAIGESKPHVLVVGTADPDLRPVLNIVILVLRRLKVELDLLLLEGVDQLPDGNEKGINCNQAADHGPELPGNNLGLDLVSLALGFCVSCNPVNSPDLCEHRAKA